MTPPTIESIRAARENAPHELSQATHVLAWVEKHRDTILHCLTAMETAQSGDVEGSTPSSQKGGCDYMSFSDAQKLFQKYIDCEMRDPNGLDETAKAMLSYNRKLSALSQPQRVDLEPVIWIEKDEYGDYVDYHWGKNKASAEAKGLTVYPLYEHPTSRSLLAVAETDGWRPIETAPKDGTEFQAWITNEQNTGFWEPRCRYDEDEVFQIWGRVDYDEEGWQDYLHLKVTHFMPLPAPPLAGKE